MVFGAIIESALTEGLVFSAFSSEWVVYYSRDENKEVGYGKHAVYLQRMAQDRKSTRLNSSH